MEKIIKWFFNWNERNTISGTMGQWYQYFMKKKIFFGSKIDFFLVVLDEILNNSDTLRHKCLRTQFNSYFITKYHKICPNLLKFCQIIDKKSFLDKRNFGQKFVLLAHSC